MSRSIGSQRLTDVADPTGAQDAATKGYVDNAVTIGSVADGAVTPAKLAGSPTITAGHNVGYDGTSFLDDGPPGDPFMRSGAFASTIFRTQINSATMVAPASGTLELVLIKLRKGTLVSKITYMSGTTALSVGSNQWFALYSSALALLGVTNDDTNTAWSANVEKQLTLAAAYTVPSTGLYYLGKLIVATTVPTMSGFSGVAIPNGLTPIIAGTSTASLTTPASAPNPAAAVTRTATVPYAWVS